MPDDNKRVGRNAEPINCPIPYLHPCTSLDNKSAPYFVPGNELETLAIRLIVINIKINWICHSLEKKMNIRNFSLQLEIYLIVSTT